MTRRDAAQLVGICLALVVLVPLAFWPGLQGAFVDFDDGFYVANNRDIRDGLTWSAFVASWQPHPALLNWHPLTWWSHALDVSMFGLEPAGHHASSMAWHAGVVLLVFFLGRSISGWTWLSAWAAAVFAVHPLRVESVVWISERKDVLCAFFWMLACLAWLHHARQQSRRSALAVTACAAAALLAKPMAVTLPCTLLLLDVWPLERLHVGWRRLLLEKAPLFLVVAAMSLTTLLLQSSGMTSVDRLPFVTRVAHVPVALVHYLTSWLLPVRLSPLYPMHADPPLVVLACSLVVLAISVLAVLFWRRGQPACFVGWAWFCGTLMPVIGVVHVGRQAWADRYTYVPGLGLVLLAALVGSALWKRAPRLRPAIMVTSLVIPIMLVALTRDQARVWRDTETLFGHALALDGDNAHALYVLSQQRLLAGDAASARAFAERAVTINPLPSAYWVAVAAAAFAQHDVERAINSARWAIERSPDNGQAQAWLGRCLQQQGNWAEAAAAFSTAATLTPDNVGIHANLGLVLEKQGDFAGAQLAFRKVLALQPADVAAQVHVVRNLALVGRTDEARAFLHDARLAAGRRGDARSVQRLLEQEQALSLASPAATSDP